MKDPVLNRYNVEEKIVDIASINRLANDPREVGLEQAHVDLLAEAVESGAPLPLPIIVATRGELGYAYAAVTHRHVTAAHELKGSKTIRALLITDQVSQEEIEDLAFFENAQKTRLPMKGPDWRKYVRRQLLDFGKSSSEIIRKMVVGGVPSKTAQRILAEVSTEQTNKLARQAARIAREKGITVKQAVTGLTLPSCCTWKTIIPAAEKFFGTTNSREEEIQATVPQQMASAITTHMQQCDRWNRDQIRLLEEFQQAGRPTDEILAVYKNIMDRYSKQTKWLLQQHDAFVMRTQSGSESGR